MPTTVLYYTEDPGDQYGNPDDNNVSWGGDGESRADLDQAADNAKFRFQWNIQVTCILLIGAVGIFILIVFLVSLYCGRRAFRKMQFNIVKPSRLKAMWTNIRVIPFRPAVIFRRPQSSSNMKTMDVNDHTIHPSESAPIVCGGPMMEDISEYTDAVEDQEPESSSACGDGFITPAERVDGLGAFPVQHCINTDPGGAKNEEYILYKVITI